jgi:hypothetical protein
VGPARGEGVVGADVGGAGDQSLTPEEGGQRDAADAGGEVGEEGTAIEEAVSGQPRSVHVAGLSLNLSSPRRLYHGPAVSVSREFVCSRKPPGEGGTVVGVMRANAEV